jgi:hypothetical protein
MASLFEPEPRSQTKSGNLARSRSRYKGVRPTTSFTSPQKPPSLATEQISYSQGKALSIDRRRANPALSPQIESVAGLEKQAARQAEKSRTLDIRDEKQCRDDQQRDFRVAENKSSVPRSRHGEPASGRNHHAETPPKRRDLVQQDRSPSKVSEEPAARPLALPKKSLTQRIAGQTSRHHRTKSRENVKRTISAPVAIEPTQSAVAPAFDAPISAVNAGERRVMVKYGQNATSVPVMPSTTPVNIIHSVAQQTSEPVNPNSTVLLESFGQLGLERPLRRYEHVRDVLNSWDNDTQHTLIIIPSPTDGKDEDLELKHVPSSQPGNTSVQIYHSQKPGSWDKRWVTLRTDGQVLVAKKDGGETSNICHLSDFDIYVPTTRQLAKKIKPPRKLCFAVKSQQKSSMFISTANFVHFFSTSDRALATAWYQAVQEWRSWYLVNVMGEGIGTPKIPSDQAHPGPGFSSKYTVQSTGSPGIDPGKRASEPRPASGTLSRALPVRNQAVPLVSLSRKLTGDANTGAPTTRKHGPSIRQTPMHSEPEPFATTSLLGRTYTQRQKAQRESGQTGATDDPLSVPGIKPLVDLTPKFQEPPQFAKRGRGITLKNIPPGGLVEAATSPEAAIPLPPTTTWQRPRTSGGGNAAADLHRARTVRKGASGSPASEARHASVSPDKGAMAFTGGLLAGNSRSQGGTGTGRGIMTGDRQAKAPMLDVEEDSQYAAGSLLDRVEKHDGVARPIIEREKRREVNAPTGEGF